MSDLDRAVQAELDAHRPEQIPAFSEIRARRRARNQRAYAVGAVALSVLAVAGVAAGSQLLNGGSDGLGPSGAAASPSTATSTDRGLAQDTMQRVAARFSLWYSDPGQYDSAARFHLQQCFDAPSTSAHAVLTGRQPAFGVVVTGREMMEAFRSCIDAVSNVKMYEVLVDRRSAADKAFIDRCVGLTKEPVAAEVIGLTEHQVELFLGSDTDRRVIARDGKCLGHTRDLRPERVNLLVQDGKVIWATRG